ncbi:MerR family transcriptional regulator [Yinghuangia seranimata]|uniref:MerR family transcriptional regulator n=1 Tax=Yinghuangia seranimata TaxID=408067 RepID=UPI00248D345A|nr:MerR family transcriptional regulator [Yinghuangia seranimata]MDI2127286.1 MerR family transcriptional regulator [Yinghuangia seranimata]
MADYRIEDLAREGGTTVRNVRAYQDRGLLPRPRRAGRVSLYDGSHLARLRLIGQLLERGYSLVSIKELLDAWDNGRSLGGVLGLVAEVTGPWSDEEPGRMTRGELTAMFGGLSDPVVIAGAVQFGLLEPEDDTLTVFRVPSPRELAVCAELHAAGVPVHAVLDHLRALRADMERVAGLFMKLTETYLWQNYLKDSSLDEAPEMAELIRRLRPLAQRAVDSELARAMRRLATRQLGETLGRVLEAENAAESPVPDEPAAPAMERYPFMSDEWIAAVSRLSRLITPDPEKRTPHPAVVDIVVSDVPGRDDPAELHMDVFHGRVLVRPGLLPGPDLMIHMDYPTARSLLLENDRSLPREALIDGRMTARGDLFALTTFREAIASLSGWDLAGVLTELTAAEDADPAQAQ